MSNISKQEIQEVTGGQVAQHVHGNQIQAEQYIENQILNIDIKENDTFKIYISDNLDKDKIFEQVIKYLLFKNELDFEIIDERKNTLKEVLHAQYDFIESSETFEGYPKSLEILTNEINAMTDDLKRLNYNIAPLFNKHKIIFDKEDKILVDKIQAAKKIFLENGILPKKDEFF